MIGAQLKTRVKGDRRLTAAAWREIAWMLLDDEPDRGLDLILEFLGGWQDADRVWISRYNDAFTHFWVTHEWSRPGITPYISELQGIPVDMAAWIHETLRHDEPVQVPDTACMPKRARPLQTEFLRQGIRSLLAVPVMKGARLSFLLGFDMVRRHHIWPEGEIAELRPVADLIHRSLHRRGAAPAAFPPSDPEDRMMHLKLDSASLAVPFSDVTWIEAAGDYTIVHFNDGRRVTECRSLKEWETLLPKADFVRVHRRAIVRVGAIARLDRGGGDWRLSLKGVSPPLTVGRAHRAALRLQLGF